MKTALRLLLLVVLLNLIRYLVGGPIESITIMEPMHAVMPRYPEVFENNFTMNHYTDPVKPFYLYSMADAAIVFSVVAPANGLLYPRIMPVTQPAGGNE